MDIQKSWKTEQTKLQYTCEPGKIIIDRRHSSPLTLRVKDANLIYP